MSLPISANPVYLVCTWRLSGVEASRIKQPLSWSFDGGDEGNRTLDIYLAKVALCQLSYVPEIGALTGTDTLPASLRRENPEFPRRPNRPPAPGAGIPTIRRCSQSSFNATALGVTFIFGSYSATSITRASPPNVVRR